MGHFRRFSLSRALTTRSERQFKSRNATDKGAAPRMDNISVLPHPNIHSRCLHGPEYAYPGQRGFIQATLVEDLASQLQPTRAVRWSVPHRATRACSNHKYCLPVGVSLQRIYRDGPGLFSYDLTNSLTRHTHLPR